jgi:hypothetical protein
MTEVGVGGHGRDGVHARRRLRDQRCANEAPERIADTDGHHRDGHRLPQAHPGQLHRQGRSVRRRKGVDNVSKARVDEPPKLVRTTRRVGEYIASQPGKHGPLKRRRVGSETPFSSRKLRLGPEEMIAERERGEIATAEGAAHFVARVHEVPAMIDDETPTPGRSHGHRHIGERRILREWV